MTLPKLRGADLHLHTVCSDGAYTPESLAATAGEHGLRIIAVTDHDSLSGVQPARQAAEPAGIEVVAGVEFATPTDDVQAEELHIVGLFLDLGCAELLDALERFRKLRIQRAMRIIEKLNQMGIAIRPDEVLNLAGPGSVTRLHVARALVNAGRVRTVGAAFKRWLRQNGAAFVPRECPPAAETIALIHRSGGVAALAHPGKTGRDEAIPSLAAAGLDAIEVYCPDHSPSQERRYLETARELGLLAGGGSDCHGDSKGRTSIGKVRLGEDAVEALRRRAERHRESRHE